MTGTHSLGIDIGGTKARAVAVAPTGEIVADVQRPVGPGLPAVLAAIHGIRDDLHSVIGAGGIASLGVGIPGVVDAREGVVRAAANLGLHEVPLAAEVEHVFGAPVALENDVSVAALGAWVWAERPSSLALLSLGTGLGVGIASGGEFFSGNRGLAGEIGHLPVDPSGPVCGCGQRGCLELYLSGTALARLWPVQEGHSGRDLIDRARLGDPDASRVFDDYIGRLAWAVQQIALSSDPDRIVIGGGVSGLGGDLLHPVQERLRADAERSPFLQTVALAERLDILPAGHPAAAIGAAEHGRRALADVALRAA